MRRTKSNYVVDCRGRISDNIIPLHNTKFPARTEYEARAIASKWVAKGGDEATCFCVQDGIVGRRPFASYRKA